MDDYEYYKHEITNWNLFDFKYIDKEYEQFLDKLEDENGIDGNR